MAITANTFLSTMSESPDLYLQTGVQTPQALSTPSLAVDVSVSSPAENQPLWSAPNNGVLPESTSNEAARMELVAMNFLNAEAAFKSNGSRSGSHWYRPRSGAIKDN